MSLSRGPWLLAISATRRYRIPQAEPCGDEIFANVCLHRAAAYKRPAYQVSVAVCLTKRSPGSRLRAGAIWSHIGRVEWADQGRIR